MINSGLSSLTNGYIENNEDTHTVCGRCQWLVTGSYDSLLCVLWSTGIEVQEHTYSTHIYVPHSTGEGRKDWSDWFLNFHLYLSLSGYSHFMFGQKRSLEKYQYAALTRGKITYHQEGTTNEYYLWLQKLTSDQITLSNGIVENRSIFMGFWNAC